MKTNNKYWGKSLDELRILHDEQVILLKFAAFRRDWEAVQKHEFELSWIMDAIFAKERGIE